MFRSPLFLLPLFLAACSAPQERGAYQRGTPVHAPARAPARPGVGLPVPRPPHVAPATPQPGPVPERLLPHTPQTASEPTIWATHPPATDDEPSILGVKLPGFEERPDVEPLVRECATLMNRALDATGLREQANNRSDTDKACLVARLQITCAEAMLRHVAHKTPEFKRGSDAEFVRTKAFYDSALLFFARCYAGNRNDPLFEDVKKNFAKEWNHGRR